MADPTRYVVVILSIVVFELVCGVTSAMLFKRRGAKWFNGLLLGLLANLLGVLIAYVMYALERSASDQQAAMGDSGLKALKAEMSNDQCSLCHARLDHQRYATGVGALLDVEHLTSRVPYRCRACHTVVCYECASTGHSGCPRCGGKVFDLTGLASGLVSRAETAK